VLLKNRELVPADVIVVQSSSANGMVYIETSGIDGRLFSVVASPSVMCVIHEVTIPSSCVGRINRDQRH
jgi:hypothetical protein